MLTYLTLMTMKNSYDEEDLLFNMIFIPITLLGDAIFILFQPLFIIAFYLYKKNRK